MHICPPVRRGDLLHFRLIKLSVWLFFPVWWWKWNFWVLCIWYDVLRHYYGEWADRQLFSYGCFWVRIVCEFVWYTLWLGCSTKLYSFFLKKNPSCSMGGLEDPYRYTYIASIMFKRQILYYNFIMENMQSNNYSIFQLMFYRQWQERLLLLFISIARLHAFGTTNFKPDFAELVILISSNWLGWIIHAIIGDKCVGVHIRLLIGEFRQNKIFWIISSRTALLVVFMWS